jgi:probable rRNA maturation factor
MSTAPSPTLPRKRGREKNSATPVMDILVESKRWAAQPRAAGTIRKANVHAAKATSTGRSALAIVLTHDSAIRRLNRDWRGFDKPTNVLSFPATAAPAPRGARRTPKPLGDIVIAYETLSREARAERKPFLHHLAHLAIHGYLHLIGHDHDDDRDADAMERLEIRILAGLRIPDPYAERPAAS